MKTRYSDIVRQHAAKNPLDAANILVRGSIMEDPLYHVERIIESYLREIEGNEFMIEKRDFIIDKMREAIEKNENISLTQTYGQWRKESKSNEHSEYEDNAICKWCPSSLLNTNDAFDVIRSIEDIRKTHAFLKERREFVNPIKEADEDTMKKKNKEMFDNAKPFRFEESVFDYARRFEDVDFILRDEDGEFVGLYNWYVKERARSQVLRIADEYDLNGVHHATLFLSTSKSKKQ